MRNATLNGQDVQLIGRCLRAAAHGPFFPDWEFHTLFGVEREVVAKVAEKWPLVDCSDEPVFLSVNNSLNHLLGYPHRKYDLWATYMHASVEDVAAVFAKWRNSIGEPLRGGRSAGERYFKGFA